MNPNSYTLFRLGCCWDKKRNVDITCRRWEFPAVWGMTGMNVELDFCMIYSSSKGRGNVSGFRQKKCGKQSTLLHRYGEAFSFLDNRFFNALSDLCLEYLGGGRIKGMFNDLELVEQLIPVIIYLGKFEGDFG
jgi:hypothetical protein